MSSIHKLTDRPHGRKRKLALRVVYVEAGKKRTKHFPDTPKGLIDAKEFKDARDRDERMRDVPDYKKRQEVEELRVLSVRQFIYRYIGHDKDFKGPLPTLKPNDITTLLAFVRKSCCSKPLPDFTWKDAQLWIDDRLKEPQSREGSRANWEEDKPLSPTTVKRDRDTIKAAWKFARRWEGFFSLPNPFEGTNVPGSSIKRRDRRLEKGELEKLEEACKDCLGLNRYYVPLAMYLAIETGMRQQEIFNLKWEDINIERRRIEILKSKTDSQTGKQGRTIVLPLMAMMSLNQLALSILKERRLPGAERIPVAGFKTLDEFKQGRVFPLTMEGNDPKYAFRQVWSDLVKRTTIVEDFLDRYPRATPDEANLQFRDLRTETINRFYEIGITEDQREQMFGHEDGPNKKHKTQRGYLNDETKLKAIQDKLDRHTLGGKTLAEMQADIEANGIPQDQINGIRKLLAERGLLPPEAIENIRKLERSALWSSLPDGEPPPASDFPPEYWTMVLGVLSKQKIPEAVSSKEKLARLQKKWSRSPEETVLDNLFRVWKMEYGDYTLDQFAKGRALSEEEKDGLIRRWKEDA